MFLGPWPLRYKRPNFDAVVYIHYASPPYSAHSGAIHFVPFGNVQLVFVSRVQRLPTKQNAYFAEGG